MISHRARRLQDVSAVIRAAREDRDLSQSELAERLAFSRDYMIDLEGAKPTVYMTRLFRTLHELGITMTLEYEDHSGQDVPTVSGQPNHVGTDELVEEHRDDIA